jgi:uncharacterized protein YbjT (DUF2867 family)
MPARKNVTVAGATGAQGGAVTRHLLGRGHRVRALVRHPQSPAAAALRTVGAELVVGDFDDPGSLVHATRGADALFAMATPFVPGGTATEVRHGKALVDAAVAAGVGHVVYSSVASADLGTGVPHFESKYAVERHLAASGAFWTVIAPTEFLDMVLAPWSLPALRDGVLGVPVPGRAPRQLTVVADVAAFAGLVIESPERFVGRRVEIASDVVTGDELAGALTRAAGRDIRYVMAEEDSAVDADLRAMYAFMAGGGYTVDIAGVRSAYPEVSWHDVDTWVRSQPWHRLLGGSAA